MASVGDARTLGAFKAAATDMAAGRISLAEARRKVREHLAASGYAPAEGTEGGLHDLRSRQRIDLTLQTNVDMARGWAARRQALGDVTHPGQELYRMQSARMPRDWARRWQEAAVAVKMEGVARDGSWRALVTSPIWAALSRFHYPYPPFDFNSGMRVRPVDAETCRGLGLLGGDWQDEMERQQRESLNADAAVSVAGLDAEVQERLDAALGALGRVDGGVARMTDLNGTREYTAGELAGVMRRGMRAGVPNLQGAALELWHDGELPEAAEPALQDLFHRVRPEPRQAEDLVYTREVPEASAAAEMLALEENGFAAEAAQAVAFFRVAAVLGKTEGTSGKVRISLRWRGARSARDFGPLLAALGKEPDRALYLLRGARLLVRGKEVSQDGAEVTYTVEEA